LCRPLRSAPGGSLETSRPCFVRPSLTPLFHVAPRPWFYWRSTITFGVGQKSGLAGPWNAGPHGMGTDWDRPSNPATCSRYVIADGLCGTSPRLRSLCSHGAPHAQTLIIRAEPLLPFFMDRSPRLKLLLCPS